MCDKSNTCGKEIKTIINIFGDEETQRCVLKNGHNGRCSYYWTKSLLTIKDYDKKDLERIADKIVKAAYMTNGETAKNSPIINRTLRYMAQKADGTRLIPVTGKEKRLLKEQGKYRVAVRKDELSTFQNCQQIEKDLVDEVLNVLNKSTSQKCYFCGDEFKIEDFISRDRKAPTAAQHGHKEPLDDNSIKHVSGNVSWQHRKCNLMQSDTTLKETFDYMVRAIENLKENFNL